MVLCLKKDEIEGAEQIGRRCLECLMACGDQRQLRKKIRKGRKGKNRDRIPSGSDWVKGQVEWIRGVFFFGKLLCKTQKNRLQECTKDDVGYLEGRVFGRMNKRKQKVGMAMRRCIRKVKKSRLRVRQRSIQEATADRTIRAK